MPVKVELKYITRWNSDLEAEVRRYEAQPAKKGQIVFYGPSNFTRWSTQYGVTPLEEALPGNSGKPCAINRGFGSSCAEHHLYYYSRMVRPLEPKVLVYAPGLGNGTSFGYTPEETFTLAERVMLYAMSDFPDLHVYLCGLPKRYQSKEALEFNGWLRRFAQETPNCTFVDVANYPGLDRTDIHLEDRVHFNAEGYRIYGELFREVLKDELTQY